MGSVGNKYRVHEVAKDFGVPTKQITEILTKYAETPKNHMQVLEDRELSLIFEYLTQHNQVSGIQVIFAEGAASAAEAEKKEKEAREEAAACRQARREEAGGQGGGPFCQAGDQARLPCASDQGGGHPQGHGGESG